MTTQQDGNSSTVSLPAIERKDLHSLLEKYDLLTEFTQGTLVCTACGTALNDVNLGALLIRGGRLVLFCNSPECIEDAMRERGK